MIRIIEAALIVGLFAAAAFSVATEAISWSNGRAEKKEAVMEAKVKADADFASRFFGKTERLQGNSITSGKLGTWIR